MSQGEWLGLLQIEHAEWVERMFPGHPQPHHHGLLGCVEEIGELEAAVTTADRLDAIADATIFLISYCTANGMSVPTPIPHHVSMITPALITEVGLLCRAQLKIEQTVLFGQEPRYVGICFKERRAQQVGRVLHVLKLYCETLGYDYAGVVRDTWERVRGRRR